MICSAMDEEQLKSSLDEYRVQLIQVENALEACGGDSPELLELKANLEEVIQLTGESLLTLRKAMVLADLESRASHDEGAVRNLSEEDSPSDNQSSSLLNSILGACVRAPFSHEWGQHQYHNAAIIGMDAERDKVMVMFCQPTHISMKICPYFLEGMCKFSDEQCKLSHGHPVNLDDLEEYEEPDPSSLSIGDACLARYDADDLWYKATIVDKLDGDILQLMYNDYGQDTVVVRLEDVIPFASYHESESDTDTDTSDVACQEELPSYLWKPNTHESMADWEQHTKGVGSRLMAAMGYTPGQGLGKLGQGRTEPVPILKLPPGKSLDKIMELKEKTGNQHMFDITKGLRKKNSLSATGRPAKRDVFTYLNASLSHGKKVDLSIYAKHSVRKFSGTAPSVISRQELTKKSDRSINVQMIKTEEEIAKVENEILALRQRLEVNVSRKDLGGIKHLSDKLKNAEGYLETLRKSQAELHRHKGQREGRKQLSVF